MATTEKKGAKPAKPGKTAPAPQQEKKAKGGDKKKADEKQADTAKPEEKKKRSFGLSGITASRQNQSGQQVASAGARGGVPDRDAVGGPNKNKLGVKVTAAEIEAFKKGIAS